MYINHYIQKTVARIGSGLQSKLREGERERESVGKFHTQINGFLSYLETFSP